MGKDSSIEWTHHTFNPWWGCFKVSPGCAHCYADTLATRYGFAVWGPAGTTQRRTFGEKHWAEPLAWNKAAEKAGERRRVFCASMADVFEDHPQLVDERAKLWPLIAATPWLDWLLLTKRPENMTRLAPTAWADEWPHNVWAGTSVESQEYADARIPHLLRTPAAVRFISYEPALGPVDLTEFMSRNVAESAVRHHLRTGHFCGGAGDAADCNDCDWSVSDGYRIDWLIAGGESGPHARPLDLNWARSLRDQCRAAGVPFLFKQVGGRTPKAGGRLLDGVEHHEFPAVRA